MNRQSKVKTFCGITDQSTVKLDLDNVSYKTAKYWAFKILKLFKSKSQTKWTPNIKIDLEGFLIAKSSPKHYHVIYNRSVEWSENQVVMAWTSLLSHNIELMKYLVMQIIKGSSTLRIGKKKDKPSPRIVFRFGLQNSEIKNYLKFRRQNKNV